MKAIAYTDGSYQVIDGHRVCGYGVALYIPDCSDITQPIEAKGATADTPACSMRNVYGEILGAIAAINLCKQLVHIDELVIVHDYEGIGKWPTGAWKAKNDFTKMYVLTVRQAQGLAPLPCKAGEPTRYAEKPLKITFQWTRGHAGTEGNEIADRLADQACKSYKAQEE